MHFTSKFTLLAVALAYGGITISALPVGDSPLVARAPSVNPQPLFKRGGGVTSVNTSGGLYRRQSKPFPSAVQARESSGSDNGSPPAAPGHRHRRCSHTPAPDSSAVQARESSASDNGTPAAAPRHRHRRHCPHTPAPESSAVEAREGTGSDVTEEPNTANGSSVSGHGHHHHHHHHHHAIHTDPGSEQPATTPEKTKTGSESVTPSQ